MNSILPQIHLPHHISPPIDFSNLVVPRLVVSPPNSSIQSRFLPSIAIGMFMDELFVEQWTNK
ncbi:unnamed protein product, partial [Rotaria magnacalcarata]